MKFTWFHLMPYCDLPANFTQEYRSVWVDIPRRLYDPKVGHRLYNDYLDQLEFADQMGFDGIGINEHHQNAYGLMPSPNIIAAALTRRTRRSSIIVLGNSIALYNPPIRVAEEFAMIDVISGGRLVAGFPIGTPMDANFCYGEAPSTLREKYREAHDLILRAWTVMDTFAFNGKFTKLRDVNLWPRPLQQPHPPVWIPSGGSVETWDFCAEQGHQYSFLSYFGYKAAKRVAGGYWNVMARKNKPLNPYSLGFAQVIALAETDQQAERDYSAHMDYFYNRCLHVYQGFADAPGYRSDRTRRAALIAQLGRVRIDSGLGTNGDGLAQRKAEAANSFHFYHRKGLTWRDLIDNGYIIAGSPATVRERLREVVQSLRCGHLIVFLQFGSMPPALVRKNTELFAHEVMPHLRDLWSDWDDHWSPRPLNENERAEPGPN